MTTSTRLGETPLRSLSYRSRIKPPRSSPFPSTHLPLSHIPHRTGCTPFLPSACSKVSRRSGRCADHLHA